MVIKKKQRVPILPVSVQLFFFVPAFSLLLLQSIITTTIAIPSSPLALAFLFFYLLNRLSPSSSPSMEHNTVTIFDSRLHHHLLSLSWSSSSFSLATPILLATISSFISSSLRSTAPPSFPSPSCCYCLCCYRCCCCRSCRCCCLFSTETSLSSSATWFVVVAAWLNRGGCGEVRSLLLPCSVVVVALGGNRWTFPSSSPASQQIQHNHFQHNHSFYSNIDLFLLMYLSSSPEQKADLATLLDHFLAVWMSSEDIGLLWGDLLAWAATFPLFCFDLFMLFLSLSSLP